jgi:hypothetical protein
MNDVRSNRQYVQHSSLFSVRLFTFHSHTQKPKVTKMSVIASTLRLSSRRVGVRASRHFPASLALTAIRSYASDKSPESHNIQSTVDSQSQGHVTDPNNVHKRDQQGQSVKGGKEAHQTSESPMDGASEKSQTGTKNFGKGNKEGVGFVDQVGSASGTGNHFEGKK